MRLNVVPSFSRNVSIQDVSVYGASAGFRGRAKPGAAVFVDAAWEYSVTKHWVLALDATYRHQGNTPVGGYNISDPNQPVRLNSGDTEAFGLAPAIELQLETYPWSAFRRARDPGWTQYGFDYYTGNSSQLRALMMFNNKSSPEMRKRY
jgi:hypothetical protein